MAAGGAVRGRTAAWLLLGLLLHLRVCVSIHAESELFDELSEESSTEVVAGAGEVRQKSRAYSQIGVHASLKLAKVRDAWKDFVNYAAKGRELEEATNCTTLPEHMVIVLDTTWNLLQPLCATGSSCNFTSLDINALMVGQEMIIAVASVADRKTCLPSVMRSLDVQAKLREFLSVLPAVLRTPETEGGQAFLRDALIELVSFQEGMLLLAGGFTDRQLFLAFDINDNCPSPCRKCDQQASPAFSFRCILARAERNLVPELPERHGVTCEAPRRRWFSWYLYSRQCHVADWKESAAQHVHVSAMLACAANVILTSMSSLITHAERKMMHGHCMVLEHGGDLQEKEQDWYYSMLRFNNGILSDGVKLAFNAILVTGLVSGLAEFRAATRGNERAESRRATLLEDGQPEEPFDFIAPFARVLTQEGFEVNAGDRAMFGDSTLLVPSDTLQKLVACDELYSLKSQNAFAEGALPVSDQAIRIRQAHGIAPMSDDRMIGVEFLVAGTIAGFLLTWAVYYLYTSIVLKKEASINTNDIAWMLASFATAGYAMTLLRQGFAWIWPGVTYEEKIAKCMAAVNLATTTTEQPASE